MLRWLKTVVVSDEEKARVMRQVGIGKTSVSHPLVKRRERLSGIETGEYQGSRDEPGGCPYCWPGGVRRRGGVSPVCGICTEHGKVDIEGLLGGLVSGGRGSALTVEAGGVEYRLRCSLADRLVVVEKPL